MTRRKHHPYTAWECYQAGMYSISEQPVQHGTSAAQLLADPSRLEAAMRAVVAAWPVSAEQYLTDLSSNRRAWLGQAAACWDAGVPRHVTGSVWFKLTESERGAANGAADRVIRDWDGSQFGAAVGLFEVADA